MSRREWHRTDIEAPPARGLTCVVAIPCRDEPDLAVTLESLQRCDRPRHPVEVIVVINGSERDSAAETRRNRATWAAAARWAARHGDDCIQFHVFRHLALSHRHAGVGLARRIAMDLALRRLERAGARDGIIASLDADCRCDANYLTALQSHFEAHPRSPGCSIYFEHPLAGGLDPLLYQAVARYELYLRYYRHGMLHARFPYAHYTVGSCMAVRAGAYRAEGGMNRRKAGEDFYFLQKLMALGGFTELNETRVVPSPRISHRAPFGTGKALAKAMERGVDHLPVCPPRVFADLRSLVAAVPWLGRSDRHAELAMQRLPRAMGTFLCVHAVRARLGEIRQNTASAATFRTRFFRWFNAFRFRKFVRFALEHHYRETAVETAAAELLRWRAVGHPPFTDAGELLGVYRRLDRVRDGTSQEISHGRFV